MKNTSKTQRKEKRVRGGRGRKGGTPFSDDISVLEDRLDGELLALNGQYLVIYFLEDVGEFLQHTLESS